jgi:hypothetical protein
MKTDEKTTTKPSTPLYLNDSYDYDLYMLLLEEIGAIKLAQCSDDSTPTPTESK